MTPRTVSILLLAAIVSVAAAAYGVSTRVDYQSTNFKGERLFPGLLENAGDVSVMTLQQRGETSTFVRDGESWSLKESGGYPVHANLVNKVIFGLSNMELLEPKTKNPDRFKDLNLGDPTQKDTSGHHVTLKNADGNVLAELIIGSANFFLPETTTGGMYVRRRVKSRRGWSGDWSTSVSNAATGCGVRSSISSRSALPVRKSRSRMGSS